MFSQAFGLFVLYSLLGTLVETAWALLRTGRLQSRKTLLWLPLCPVYGFGALAILGLVSLTQKAPLTIALAGVVGGGGVEYLYAWACETWLGVRLWDYGTGPFSLHGRVHALFCLAWALLAMALFFVHPAAVRLTAALPEGWAWAALPLVAADAICTSLALYRFGHGTGPAVLPFAQRRQPVTANLRRGFGKSEASVRDPAARAHRSRSTASNRGHIR
ncbi:MAG: putative ABC transporter permease [Oscillospiraceae bacterium]|jgi:uncharacterized membrane protein|nr:putative ABC transporter permease [Oscillospiraceae bacterium]